MLDDLARDLASGAISRRTALGRLAKGALGITLVAAPSALADELERANCPKSRRCGKKCCPKGAKCKNGKCKCKAGRKKCGKQCVDLQTSAEHCGSCNNACEQDEACVAGECTPGAECSVPGDCPTPSDPCLVATCASGTCGTTDNPGIDDGLDCTIDTCDSGTGSISHNIVAGTCLVAGVCYQQGATCAGGGTCQPDTSNVTCSSTCGNGTIEPGESCDGANLGGNTCVSLGFTGGTLACSGCQYDTSGCTSPACDPGDTRSCYSGPVGTEGVGICAAGTQTCTNQGEWGPCEGEVLPSQEVCDNLDNNCNGLVDQADPTMVRPFCTCPGGSPGTQICVDGQFQATCICNDCDDPSDCPGDDTDCQTRTCINGGCSFTFENQGAPTSNQTPGDCKEEVCDGAGGTMLIDDNFDSPADSSECTTGTCSGGVPGQSLDDSFCDDFNECTVNTCDEFLGCVDTNVLDDTPCSQGGGSTCQNGACV